MQLPASQLLQTHPSIFQAILEESSSKESQIQEIRHECSQNQLATQLFREQLPHSPDIWFMMDEVPFDDDSQQQPTSQDPQLDFHKVKSFREEQQTKIAQFLRDDKYKSLRNIEIAPKDGSPLGKSSQSLSPRKTKKIDKTKVLKFFPESV